MLVKKCGKRSNFAIGLAFGVFLTAISGAPARADTASDFYQGKSITLLLGFGAGGMYGLYARLLADHMPRHIPGKPAIVPQFMPGAGGVKAANYFYNAAPRDGSMMGMLSQAIAVTQLLRAGTKIKYDASKLNWIGSVDQVVNLLSVWNATSPAKSIEELRKKQIVTGATGKGSIGFMNSVMAKQMLGAKLRIITGYKGIAGVDLAMENGEVQGRTGTWISIKARKQNWIDGNKVSHIVQFALKKHPELPDVPLAIDLARNSEEKAMLEFAASSSIVGRALSFPPGTPKDRVAALRKAFEATVRDPGFLAAAKKRKLSIIHTSADEVSAVVRKTISTPASLIKKFRAVLAAEK